MHKVFFTGLFEISFGLFVWQLGSIYLLVGSERKWKPKYNFQLLYLKETFWVIVIPFCILTCAVIFIYGSKKQKFWQTSVVIKIELEWAYTHHQKMLSYMSQSGPQNEPRPFHSWIKNAHRPSRRKSWNAKLPKPFRTCLLGCFLSFFFFSIPC